jgi:hypothetical protein
LDKRALRPSNHVQHALAENVVPTCGGSQIAWLTAFFALGTLAGLAHYYAALRLDVNPSFVSVL